MLQQSKHGRKSTDKWRHVAGVPLPDRYDPARAIYTDIENVLLEAGYVRAVALLRAAGRGPTCYVVDGTRVREVLV